LEVLIRPGVEALGFELVAVELSGRGAGTVLRVYIDSPDGITVDDCADVSGQVSAILDVEDPIPGHYTLEVSSPGLDRPLARPEHFARVVGEKVRVNLAVPREDNRRRLSGPLVAADADGIDVDVDGEIQRVRYAEISRARLVPALGAGGPEKRDGK